MCKMQISFSQSNFSTNINQPLQTLNLIQQTRQNAFRTNAGCPDALRGCNDMTLSISLDCLHHQGALAKRPALLGSGLPSTLVRMAHCHQNSLFTRKFNDALEHYADHVVQRVCVHTLPEASAEWRQRNYDLLRPCRIKWKTLAPFCRIFPS